MISLGIASDHGGFELKQWLINHFSDYSFIDLGTNSDESVHYPHFADALCDKILTGSVERGVLICGTGLGISMRANRYPGIRAAVVYDAFTAEMSKAHNNANIICLGGRTLTNEAAAECISIWNTTTFESGRHQHRLDLLDQPI